MPSTQRRARKIPLWLKLIYSAFVCVIVPVYWRRYGADNFLWFSDIAMLTTLFALWLESSLLASTMCVGVLIAEIIWNFDFFSHLIMQKGYLSLASYMFDANRPRFVRGLSLFHVVLPFLLLWMLHRLGYDRRAFWAMTFLAWIVFPVTYRYTKYEDDVNWVFGPGAYPQKWMPPLIYLGLLMIVFPLLIYLPTHLLLVSIFPRRQQFAAAA